MQCTARMTYTGKWGLRIMALEIVTARYERQSDSLWRAQIDEHPEVIAAARTLDRARREIRRALLARHPEAPRASVVDQIGMSPECEATVARALETREEAVRAAEAALSRTKAAATALVADGFSLRDASSVLGLSHTRVQQLLERE